MEGGEEGEGQEKGSRCTGGEGEREAGLTYNFKPMS